MTLARGAALGALTIAVIVLAVILLRSGGSHTYHVMFENAGQLVNGDDVQVGGRRVGTVHAISLTDNNQADVQISVENGFAPLHDGTTASIRATSLSGIANRYVALTPGANNSPTLSDGARLGTDQTTSIVDLDQIFDTLNPPTLRGLQQVIQGSAQQYSGMGAAANASAHYFNPLLSTSSQLVSEAISDQKAFSDFVTSSSRVVTTLAQRDSTLTNLVGNTSTTAGAIGAENRSLSQALGLLPGTLRKANTTFVNLRNTLGDLTVLTDASKPATKRLAPFLAALRPLVHDARPTIHDLRLLIHAPNNLDLTHLLLKAPRLEQVAKPSFAHTITAIQKSTPVVQFIRPYAPDLIGWLRDFGQGAANYDANGHFARIQPIFNAYSFAANAGGGVLSPIPPDQRLNNLQTNIGQRCPGTASQPPVDRSAPYRDANGNLDCNPNQLLPGP